tara:strand:- start:62 stop:445 length:384 start_codon:yes stop_codon:yes gene_type:complete
MKKLQNTVFLLILSFHISSESYSCPYIDEAEAELFKIERVVITEPGATISEGEGYFTDVMYPEAIPWEIFFEDDDFLVLTNYIPNDPYEFWSFVLDKNELTFQWGITLSSQDIFSDAIVTGKCIKDI